jgi:outer membrane protein OmpA-like peptidoglycan-associated protein
MKTKETVLAATAFGFLLSFSSPGLALNDEGSTNRNNELAEAAEDQADIASEEAKIARESLALEERKAALAERKASVAKREAKLAKEIDTQTARLEQELAELRARETERGLILTLGDVLFESDQAQLTADAMRKLYPLVTLLKENSGRDITIEGFTDSNGAESYNLNLSQQRADAVGDFLVANGINPERINARGYGEANPVASNVNETGRRENRRVEVVVMREGDRVANRTR